MPWTYRQSTGELLFDGHRVSVGYAGRGEHRNRPSSQHVMGWGPIPRGMYAVGAPINHARMGPFCLPLAPNLDNYMEGRSAFYIHGDDRLHDASHGCIVLDRSSRSAIWSSGDLELHVVE